MAHGDVIIRRTDKAKLTRLKYGIYTVHGFDPSSTRTFRRKDEALQHFHDLDQAARDRDMLKARYARAKAESDYGCW